MSYLSYIFFFSLLMSIIPLILVGFYAHPTGEDFGNASGLYPIVKSGGHLWDIIKASFWIVKWKYFHSQGIYAAAFFTTLTPLSFSENLYFLTPILALTSVIGATYFFVDTLFKVIGFERKYGVIVSSILLLLSIQFVDNKHEAFFWFPAFSNYTIFYALSLVLFSLLIKMYGCTKTDCLPYLTLPYLTLPYLTLPCLIAIIIGGGNFSTSLVTLVLLSIAFVFIWKTNRRFLSYFLTVYALLFIGFIISVIAPGNSIRAASYEGMSATNAIIKSITYSVFYIGKWTGLAQLVGFTCVALIALVLTKQTKFQYRYPLLVMGIAFLVFATQLTPPLYALGRLLAAKNGEGRLVDIIQYSYHLFMSFCIFYLCGWFNYRKPVTVTLVKLKKSEILSGFLLLVCLLTITIINSGVRNLFFVDALLALKNGTAQSYHEEYLDRFATIKGGQTTIRDITIVPDFFSDLRIREDANYWRNEQMARYFGVDEIRLQTDENENDN